MKDIIIEKIVGREIFDSRGQPTVEAEVYLSDGSYGRGKVPSGASTGRFEALELRDGDKKRFDGKGVTRAVSNINSILNRTLQGMNAYDIYTLDGAMRDVDGTEDKSGLGANSMLAVSIAACRAASNSLGIPLFRFLGGINGNRLPVPMMNILNGGSHATNNLDIQEFMIIPTGASSFKEALRSSVEVYHALKNILEKEGLSTGIGDEGGFAPNLNSEEEAFQLLVAAINKAGYNTESDFGIGIDGATSQWRNESKQKYVLPKSKKVFSSTELINYWENLCSKYPIQSIEDGMAEEDWDGWQKLTKKLGNRIQLVGDDLFVTNTFRLKKGITMDCGNSILIKMNQIGTVTEAMEAVKMAQEAGYSTIVSHRSGETEDTTISDFAVAMNSCQIKTGAPCRSERVAKYNRLLEIEEYLGYFSFYPGVTPLNNI
ncbi:MAG: phosphopyruvate hydratase [Spirochaetaceae bacterium]|nr:phosphopyruvate hydratase [Spirochaetaceae bacterium]